MKPPIQTKNIAMAIAMHLAGVRPWQPESFAMVVYDEKELKRLGCTTVKQAVTERKLGQLVCSFNLKDSAQYQHLQEVWDDERARIEAGLESEVQVSASDMVRIVARTLHCRKQLTQQWPDLPIWVMIPKEVSGMTVQEDQGRTVITHPGFIMVNYRASDALLSELGLLGAGEEAE